MPDLIDFTLHDEDAVISFAEQYKNATTALSVACGGLVPSVLEGERKVKEVSPVHAEGFAACQPNHGPIAPVDHSTPVVASGPNGQSFPNVASNVSEIAVCVGQINVLGNRRAILALSDVANFMSTIPSRHDLIQCAVATIPMKFPRNLANSVTVA